VYIVRRSTSLALFVCLLCLGLAPAAALASTSEAGYLSDPAGKGRPTHHDDPLLTALSTRFYLHGFYRMRWNMLDNLDLDRGPTPSTNKTIFPTRFDDSGALQGGDMRFRMELSMDIARSVKIHARIDALDNIVLGSTPNGFPRNARVPMSVATTGQRAPVEGVNAFTDSIRVRRVYGEVMLPFGYLAAGRMGALTPWGLGLLVQPGNALDADNGDNADRIVFAIALLGHLLLATYEFSSSGPVIGVPFNASTDQDPRDDVRSFAFALANYDTPETVKRKLRAGMSILNYGLIFSYRDQQLDVPGWYAGTIEERAIRSGEVVQRNAYSMLLDFWFLYRNPWLRIELEAIYAQGNIANGSLVPGVNLTEPLTSSQYGGVLQIALSPPRSRWGVGVEVGLASGDDAPGFGVAPPINQIKSVPGDIDGPQINYPNDNTVNNFRFHPDYRVDLIFWRRIVGQVTDALYFKGAAHFDLTQRLRFWTSVIYSRAMEASTPPGGSAELGVEIDAGLRYNYDPGFEIQLSSGVFVPFAGLRNTELSLDPRPAFVLQLILGYVF